MACLGRQQFHCLVCEVTIHQADSFDRQINQIWYWSKHTSTLEFETYHCQHEKCKTQEMPGSEDDNQLFGSQIARNLPTAASYEIVPWFSRPNRPLCTCARAHCAEAISCYCTSGSTLAQTKLGRKTWNMQILTKCIAGEPAWGAKPHVGKSFPHFT